MSIFLNKDKLSPLYIPKTLPHREGQLQLLSSLFKDVLERIEEAYLKFAQLIGGVGTGKTCTAIKFGRSLEEEAKRRRINLKHVYINLKLEGGSRFILHKTLQEKAAPELSTRGLSPEEMLRQMVKYLRNERKYCLITFDEIDYYVKHYVKEHVIYDLTRIGEVYPGEPIGVVGVLFIARDIKWRELLEPSEISSLGRVFIEFPKYSASQIKDILKDRVLESFRHGAVSHEVLDFISEVTAKQPINGDIRYGLDLLLYSGILADSEGYGYITLDHVRRVHGKIHPAITTDDILNLPDIEKYILLSVAKALKNRRTSYVSLKDVMNEYKAVCEEHKIKPVKDLEEYIQDLYDRGIVDIKLLKIGILGIPTEDLIQYLDDLIERVKLGLEV